MVERLHYVAPIAYVDGFNWYYGIFKYRPAWKWLNIQSFFEELRATEDIVAVKFFTAWVGKGRALSEKRDRQTRYYTALQKECPKVIKILGDFKTKKVTCGAECRKDYYSSVDTATIGK